MEDLEKLKHYIIAGGFNSQIDLSLFLGVPAQSISEWKTKKRVPKKHIQKLEKEFGIIEKDGDTIKFIRDPDHIATHLAKIVTENSVIKGGVTKLDTPYLITVPIMSARPSGSKLIHGVEHFEVEETGKLVIDKMLFKILPQLDNIQAVRVRGDSMNPTLREDDYVVIELEERFSGDGIYVLSWDGILLVKRLQAGNMVIKVLSDNQSFESMEYNPTEDQRTFHIVGKVILRIQR